MNDFSVKAIDRNILENLDLDHGFRGRYSYSPSERALWQEKLAGIESPLEWGYADGWVSAFNWTTFLGFAVAALCVALSGVFSSEYQNRTDSIVLPTKLGKSALPRAKVVASLIFTTMDVFTSAVLPCSLYCAAVARWFATRSERFYRKGHAASLRAGVCGRARYGSADTIALVKGAFRSGSRHRTSESHAAWSCRHLFQPDCKASRVVTAWGHDLVIYADGVICGWSVGSGPA